MPRAGTAIPRRRDVDELLPVQGVVERLPNLHVVEGFDVRVEAQIEHTQVRGYLQFFVQRLAGITEPLHVVEADVGNIEDALLVGGYFRQTAEELHLLELGLFSIVLIVARQDQQLVRLPLTEHERAGAVGTVGPVRAGLDVLAVHDIRRRVGQLGQEVGFRLVNRNLDGVVAAYSHADNLIGGPLQFLAHADNIAQVRGGHRRSRVRIGRPLQAVLDVLRADQPAVVEGRVLAQFEGIHPAIGTHLPAFGQIGDHLELLVEADQPAEQVGNVERRRSILYLRRIERDDAIKP